jgi:hypothetical protein
MKLMARFLHWLMLDKKAGRRTLLVGVYLAGAECVALLIAAIVDRDFWLAGRAIGLFEHPGIAAVIVADFVVLTMLGYTTRRFVRLPGRLPIIRDQANRRLLRRFTSRGRQALLLRGPAFGLFLFSAGLGTLFWLLNAIQTLDPIRYYGRDVFDSALHPVSYGVFRFILWLSWGIIYPYAAVVFLAIAGNLYFATRTLLRHGQLTYRVFHPDRCGGFSIVGDISFATIMTLAALYISLTTIVLTHHNLSILQISGFVLLSLALLILTFLIAWPVTRFMLQRRRTEQNRSYRRLRHEGNAFTVAQLAWLGLATSPSPYAVHQKILINGARILPLILAGVRLSKMI